MVDTREILVLAPNQTGKGTETFWASFFRSPFPKELDGVERMEVLWSIEEAFGRVRGGRVAKLLAGVEYSGDGRVLIKKLLAYLSTVPSQNGVVPEIMLVHGTGMPNEVVMADLRKGTGVLVDFRVCCLARDTGEIGDFLMGGWVSRVAVGSVGLVPTVKERLAELERLPVDELVKTRAVDEVFGILGQMRRQTGVISVGYADVIKAIQIKIAVIQKQLFESAGGNREKKESLVDAVLRIERGRGVLAGV